MPLRGLERDTTTLGWYNKMPPSFLPSLHFPKQRFRNSWHIQGQCMKVICDGPQSDSSLHLMPCSSGGWSKYNPLALTGHKVSGGQTATMKQTLLSSQPHSLWSIKGPWQAWDFTANQGLVSAKILQRFFKQCRLQSSYFACFLWTEKALYVFPTASRNAAVSCRVVNTLIQLVRASHIYKTWSNCTQSPAGW